MEGFQEGSPELPGLTQRGNPLLPIPPPPPGVLPMAPSYGAFLCPSAFVHEASLTQPKVSGGPDGDMAGSHLVFSQNPQTSPVVVPSASACLSPTTPFFSALESLSMFTICQLGRLNPLHTESQPAKCGCLGSLPTPLFPLGWRNRWQGERKESAVSPLAKRDRGHGLFAVNCFSHSRAGSPGVEVRGGEGWRQAGACE